MRTRRTQGFTLVEFVIAIVFVGVVLGPFLVFVSRLHDMNSAIGQQARREAWRSFNDQALAAGIDPTLAPGLASTMNTAVPAVAPPAVTQVAMAVVSGLPRIVPLHIAPDPTVAETRIAGAGLQIGAGAAVAARTIPAPPLTPIVMPMPIVTPADGSVIATSSLAAGVPDDPYTLNIQAAVAAGSKITMVLNQPFTTVNGIDIVQQAVSAVDLLNRVTGTAWAEYPGNAETGDRSLILSDGRTRWFVTRTDGRLQIYEPSANMNFAYRIGLGAPVVRRGVTENAAGGSLSFDYAAYYAVQTGATSLGVDFPTAVKSVFGNGWAAQSIGFQTTFHDAAAPFSGDLKLFFATDTLGLWGDSVTVATTPVVPLGAIADSATWTFARVKSELGVPRFASTADTTGFYTPGEMQFTAPLGPDGTPIGRLSFQNGTALSTGPTLSISVIP